MAISAQSVWLVVSFQKSSEIMAGVWQCVSFTVTIDGRQLVSCNLFTQSQSTINNYCLMLCLQCDTQWLVQLPVCPLFATAKRAARHKSVTVACQPLATVTVTVDSLPDSSLQ